MNYDFRRELLTVHEKNVRDLARKPASNEKWIFDGAVLKISEKASEVICVAAEDFCDFLSVSMGVSACVAKEGKSDITLALASETGVDLGEFAAYQGFRIETDANGIVITAHDERGAAQALYYIEDLMTFAEAPFLPYGKIEKRAMYTPKMVHSAYDMDVFPDEYLARIAHEGRDAILVFTKDVNKTPAGDLDFNDLIRRAARYGIDVYAYSYMKSGMNPEEEGAEAYYDELYGKLFRECPGLKGVTLVGESVGFPTKDPNAAAPGETAIDGIPTGKVHSGFYPCYDYPIWLNLLKKVIHKHKPDADIVFWTYNFTWRTEEERIGLIRSLPTDISLLVTFERFELLNVGASKLVSQDYSLAFVGPSKIFAAEAKAAKECGIRLYSMTNTAGKTWDFGTAPYEPMPYQWMRRYDAMKAAQENFGLSGIMECHHYGMYPSFISKLSKHAFMLPTEPYEDVLRKIVAQKYGRENVETVLLALREYSEAITYLTPTKDDEHGALRVGPAHPLNLFAKIKIPCDADAHFGNRIWYPHVYTTGGWQSPHSLRVRDEMASMQKTVDHMERGNAALSAIGEPNAELSRLLGLGRFISNTVKTCIASKKIYILDSRMRATGDPEELLSIADDIEAVLRENREVVLDTIPLVEADSALGYEPSMHYMTDKWHLDWKLRHTDYVLNTELRELREAVTTHLK